MGKRKNQPLPPDAPGTRFTQERLFWNINEETIGDLKEAWSEGEQLSVELIPEAAICAVLMLTAWGLKNGMELVDDYPALVQQAREHLAVGTLHHPDLFFVSTLCILDARAEQPTIGGFTQIGIPDLFEDLIGKHME